MSVFSPDSVLCKCCQEKLNNNTKAIGHCQQCKVAFCEGCAKTHSQRKATSSHTFIELKPPNAETKSKTEYECNHCKKGNGETFCTSCNLHLCKTCLQQHKRVHRPRNITRESATVLNLCSECKRYGTLSVSDKICSSCVKHFCQECCNLHKCTNDTGSHSVAFDVPICEPCECMTIITTAKTLCLDCDELLCDQCSELHTASFELHKLKLIQGRGNAIKNTNLCGPCNTLGREEPAAYICIECDNKLFCEGCAIQHTTFKRTKFHKISSIVSSPKFTDDKETQTESFERANKETETFPNKDSLCVLEHTPGKPEASYIGIDSITLKWKEAETFDKSGYYQVSYQETDNQRKWTLYGDDLDLKVPNITINHLKTNTAYIFRVRVENEVGEGPYSPVSDRIITRTSSAGMLMSFSQKLQDGNPSPTIYALPVKENVDTRNDKAKTKRLEIGESTKGNSSTEKTIMMLGTSACGKGTLIDNMINYIIGVQWTDAFRFSTRSKTMQDEMKAHGINIFTVRPEQGSRLQYQLNIVDVPSFNISKPLDENLEILEQVRVLLSDPAPLGLDLLDAVCFVVRSTDPELDKFQEILFQQVLSIFGKDMSSNIFTMLTFADFKDPPILKFISKTKMPFRKTFTFNLSALFLNNVGLGAKTTLQMFWNASAESLKNFFKELDNTRIQSLKQTKFVIEQRSLFKANFDKIQRDIDNVLKKANELSIEQNEIEQEENITKSNENFTFKEDKTEAVLTELPSGKYAVNCNHCKSTCCQSVDSEHVEIGSCDAMDSSGKCKVCINECIPTSHIIESNIYTDSTEKITKVDQAKKDAYEKANIELQRLEYRVQILSNQLSELCGTLKNETETINKCRQQIDQNSLWPHGQGLENEIELSIEILKQEKKEGFIDKIRSLREFRKYVEITKNVDQFADDARSILEVVGRNRPENNAATSNLARLEALFKFVHAE